MKKGTLRTMAGFLLLFLLLALPAGCEKPPQAPTVSTAPAAPTPSPGHGPASPSPAPKTGNEEMVYMPAYEAYPPDMDPLYTRCAVEREDGVWFIRQVQEQEEMYYALMHGGRDAADPVTVIAFDPGVYVDWFCLLGDDRVWVDQLDYTTWETVLLEISPESGEILREVPFPAENGLILGLFDLPGGSLGISAASLTTGEQTVFQMEEDGTFSELKAPLDEEKRYLVTFLGTAGSGLPEGECMAYDKKALFAFTPGSGERRELMPWAEWGIFFGRTSPLGMQDGTVRLLDYGYGEYVTLTPTPRSRVPVRQEVTLSCLTAESAVTDAVRDFNRRSGEYFVTIRDYSDGRTFTRDVQDQAITAMNLDIVNGNMPDLLSVQDGVPFKSYAEKGLLRDLTPWLEEEGIELLPQLLRAGTVDGKLLMVCGSFGLLTAAGSRDYVGDISGWTVAEAASLAASLPEDTRVFTAAMTRDKYMEWLSWYLEGYLDWDKGTASFDSPEFRDVLAFAASLPPEAPAAENVDLEIMQGRALAEAITITSIGDWRFRDLVYMGKLCCPGLPTGDRVGSLIQMKAPMALSASSARAEGALAFLKSMLDEKNQTADTGRFPALRSAFESQLGEAMREPAAEEGYTVTYILPGGDLLPDGTVYLWDGSSGERAPRAVYRWFDENYAMIREETMYAMSEEQRDSLLALLDGAVRSSSYDQVIAGIVEEEAGALFAGQRSAAEVAGRIQSRAELYLAEQG